MRRALPFTVAFIAACSSDPATTPTTDAGADVGTAVDAPVVDAPAADVPVGDVPVATDTPVTGDTGTPSRCGTERPDISSVRGTEGLVIAADGTIYFSQSRAVGRIRPGMAPEARWASLPSAASTVWGLAIDVANRRLYAGSPATATIYAVDLTADAPVATVYLSGAGGPNGLTMGPDGALYYSDFNGGHVWRVVDGVRTRVTTTTIRQPNGVAFHRDGSLYVDSYGSGTLFRLTLAGNMESERSTVATSLGSPDGLAFDAMGRIYIGDNGGGRLIRLDADGSNPEVLQRSISAAANIEFGTGALPCSDIYVASGGTLVRYEMGDTAGASVPWH